MDRLTPLHLHPGPVPSLHSAYAATGHDRSGILLAPITGLRHIAERAERIAC
jgi:glycine/D-amino acid oxidase-like deaminating enzyme